MPSKKLNFFQTLPEDPETEVKGGYEERKVGGQGERETEWGGGRVENISSI